MALVGRTFARHCSAAGFFVAADSAEKVWRQEEKDGGHRIFNMAQLIADYFARDSRLLRNEGSVHRGGMTMLEAGNTIIKVFTMFMVAYDLCFDEADVFCKLDLDVAFVVENLQAFCHANGIKSSDLVYISGRNYFWKHAGYGAFPDGGGGICVTRAALEALSATLHAALIVSNAGQPYSKCNFQLGHYEDMVLSACFRIANITAHPAFYDVLGRGYSTDIPLPCEEHVKVSSARGLLPLFSRAVPSVDERRAHLRALWTDGRGRFGKSSWFHQMHRYFPCEPAELALVGADYWLSPFAFGFHGYKVPAMLGHAYDVIYNGASCTWLFDYRFQLAVTV